MEDFSFAIHDIFLQVECRGLGNTEVFHCIGYRDAGLLANLEKVIYSSTACKNNRGMIQDVDLLSPEVFGLNAFNLNEWPEVNLDITFFS